MPFKNYEDKKLHNINYRLCKSTLTDTTEIKYFLYKKRCCYCGDNLIIKNIHRTLGINILCNRCYSYVK